MGVLPSSFKTFGFWLALAAACSSATYYFANDSTGSDLRTRIEAGNSSTPWKSFGPLDTVALQPGDNLLLKSGCVWRATMRIKQTGLLNKPISISGYGAAGVLPEIRGTDSISGLHSNGVWEAVIPASQQVKAVFDHGAQIGIARFPSDTGWLFNERYNGDTTLYSSKLGNGVFTGASIHMRTKQWIIETRKIHASTPPGEIELDSHSLYSLSGTGFFITNDTNGFLAAGSQVSWYQSSRSNRLYWKNLPSQQAWVEASVRPYGIELFPGVKHVKIRGIRIFGTSQQAIASTTSNDNALVQECEIVSPGLMGIRLVGRDIKILRNRIIGAGSDAISTFGFTDSILENEISNTGLPIHLGPDGIGYGMFGARAIHHTGNQGLVRKNTIQHTGYNGIHFDGKVNVDSNFIRYSCEFLDDCGGIYTITGNPTGPGSAGSQINNNIVLDAYTPLSGLTKHYNGSHGIYIDDGSHDMVIKNNTVAGNEYGIFLHNTIRDTIQGNTLYSNRISQLAAQQDELAGDQGMYNNLITQNTSISKAGQGYYKQEIYRTTQPFEINWVDNIQCTDLPNKIQCYQNTDSLWEFSQPYMSQTLWGPETQRPVTLRNSKTLLWSAWPSQTALSIDSISKGCSLGCLKIEHSNLSLQTSPSPLVNGGGAAFPVPQGSKWILGFWAKSNLRGMILSPKFRRSYGDYGVLGLSPDFQLDTTWKHFEGIIQATAADSLARIDFHNTAANSIYWLDSVSLRQVLSASYDTLPGSSLLYSRSVPTSPASLPNWPAWYWVDAYGKAIPSTQSVSAFQSAVAFPVRASPTSIAIPATKPAPEVRLKRVGNSLVIDGVMGKVTIYDARGKRIVQLDPDPNRRVAWVNQGLCTPCWLITNHKVFPILSGIN